MVQGLIMEKLIILLLILNLFTKTGFKIFSRNMVLGKNIQRKSITIINLVFIVICFFLSAEQLSIGLLKINSFYDLFFIMFCYCFYELAGCLCLVITEKLKIQKNSYEEIVLQEDFTSLIYSLIIFINFQYKFLDFDLAVLLISLIYGVLNLSVTLWIYKKISSYQLIFSSVLYFYALFIFAATNNLMFSIAFFMLLKIPVYISYKKKGVYSK